MIYPSELQEAKFHLQNALHHAQAALRITPTPELNQAVILIEETMLIVTEANEKERKTFYDDTKEV